MLLCVYFICLILSLQRTPKLGFRAKNSIIVGTNMRQKNRNAFFVKVNSPE